MNNSLFNSTFKIKLFTFITLYSLCLTLVYAVQTLAETKDGVALQSEDLIYEHRTWPLINNLSKLAQVSASGDFNGDGKGDFLAQSRPDGKWIRGLSSEGQFVLSDAIGIPYTTILTDIVSGDFNADGIADLAGLIPNQELIFVAIADRSAEFHLLGTYYFSREGYSQGSIAAADCNGDGLDDLVVLIRDPYNNHLKVYLADLVSQQFLLKPAATWLTIASYVNHFVVGDINADGAADSLIQLRAPIPLNEWIAGISNKENAFSLSWRGDAGRNYFWSSFPPGNGKLQTLMLNLNGDKMSDQAVRNSDMRYWWAAFSNGTTGIEQQLNHDELEIKKDVPVFSDDFDGDGLDDIMLAEVKDDQVVILHSRMQKEHASLENSAGPSICLGYNPGDQISTKWGRNNGYCAPGYAYFGANDENKSGAELNLSGDCCKLPATDILTDNHLFASEACPPNYVSTGNRGTWVEVAKQTNNEPKELRCTKINTKRYQLGIATSGVYWGTGASLYWEGKIIDKGDIPVSIRHGIGRVSIYFWDTDGCIGDPLGSLLVAKAGSSCKGLTFSQLQYKGAAGDPPQGTPVSMFPNCRSIGSVFDPTATCNE